MVIESFKFGVFAEEDKAAISDISIARFVYKMRDTCSFCIIRSKPELEVEEVEVPKYYAQYHWKVYTELRCQN